MSQGRREVGSGNLIIGAIVLVLFFVGAYYIFKGISWVLWFIAPVLIIATLVMDRQVVIDYFKWLFRQFKQNLPLALLMTLVTVVGYQFVAVYLFGKALFKRKIRQMTEQAQGQQRPGEFIDYTIIDDEDVDAEVIELKEIPAPKPRKKDKSSSADDDDSYEQLFD